MSGKKEPPDWDQFEVYKGEEPGSQRPAWLDRLIHWVLLGLFLVLVFAVGGALSFLVVSRRLAMVETASGGWGRFIAGGVLADAVVLGWIHGRNR